MISNLRGMRWRTSTVAKRAHCSTKGLEFDSQHHVTKLQAVNDAGGSTETSLDRAPRPCLDLKIRLHNIVKYFPLCCLGLTHLCLHINCPVGLFLLLGDIFLCLSRSS